MCSENAAAPLRTQHRFGSKVIGCTTSMRGAAHALTSSEEFPGGPGGARCGGNEQVLNVKTVFWGESPTRSS